MIAVPGLTLLPSSCSALSCSPRYPPRIAYFSHSLHLSEKHLLNFVLSSPLINILYGYMSFHLSNQKCFFFTFFTSSTLWVPYIIRIIPGCHDLFSSIKSKNGFLFSHNFHNVCHPHEFSHIRFRNIVFNSILVIIYMFMFNFVSSPWQLKCPLHL